MLKPHPRPSGYEGTSYVVVEKIKVQFQELATRLRKEYLRSLSFVLLTNLIKHLSKVAQFCFADSALMNVTPDHV